MNSFLAEEIATVALEIHQSLTSTRFQTSLRMSTTIFPPLPLRIKALPYLPLALNRNFQPPGHLSASDAHRLFLIPIPPTLPIRLPRPQHLRHHLEQASPPAHPERMGPYFLARARYVHGDGLVRAV